MITDINYVLIPIMLAALIALWPAWMLLYRITFSSRRWWLSGLRLIAVFMLSAGLGALAFHVPFWLSSGKSVGPFETLIDLLLYGVFPLVAVGLVAYAMDHFSERPMMIVLAAAACISIAGLPVAYMILGDDYHKKFEIVVEKPNTTTDGDTQGDSAESTVDGTGESTFNKLDAAELTTDDSARSNP